MAFDGSQTTADWHILFEVDLDSGTVRYADVDMTMDDGTAYDGRIASVPVLRLSLGPLLDPRFVSPGFVVSLHDADHEVRDSTDDEPWGNRMARLKLGQTTDLTVYETLFTGVVRFPGSTEWDETSIRVNVDDLRRKDSKALPANLFNPATYANLEAKSYYLPIPLIYGSWLTTDAAGEKLSAYQIDSTAGTGGKFKIADHAMKSIEVVYLNGADITANCTLDAANGEFTISSTSTYDSDADTVTVNCSGATDDGLTTGTLLVDLPDQIDDLLQTHLSVAAGNVDSAAFATWAGFLGSSEEARRWIGGAQVSSDDLIRDAMIEGMADLPINGGKYAPAFRIPTARADSTQLVGANVREVGDPPHKDLTVRLDPEGIYANQVVSDYQYDPTSEGYAKTYTKTDATEVALMGTTKRRRFRFMWFYKQVGVERRTDREVHLYGKEPEMMTVRLDPEGLTKLPTDQFLFTHDKYSQTPFQVRATSLDLTQKLAMATCWYIGDLVGRWKAAGSNDWAARTTADEQGYWTDAAGLADSTDPASTGSTWF